MSFLYQNHSVVPPPGTIIQYIGTSDPDGWILCNGLPRTEGDGRFGDLSRILNSMGSDVVNNAYNCTPPDLRERFLYGKSDSVSVGMKSGSTNKQLVENNLPSHTHSVADPKHNHGGSTGTHTHPFKGNSHSHYVKDPGHSHSYKVKDTQANEQGSHTATWGDESTQNTKSSGASISVNNTKPTGSILEDKAPISKGETNITINSTGSSSAFDIMPPYFVINHIIKY